MHHNMKSSFLQSSKNKCAIVCFPLEQQLFVLFLLARYGDGPNFFYFVLYAQKPITIAMHMATFSNCHRSCHKKKDELSSIRCHLSLFYQVQDRSPCLLIDTYHDSQPYLVLLHVWKVEKAVLLRAAEEPSCAPAHANETFNSRGASHCI